ncbi:hypothetical protein HBH53_075730 [Parastagonospora nodorum]|nr:hypothetical protein HBH53_075730 [Parastagonospora nodorum]KAH5170081.1 hypothetical protein HBI73_006660 [Parastagonospora nodorum]KAH6233424.1 hypothetical protein HBI43_022130 [Parastagonospora nodorum]KAH6275114.1 hypothetical protein HBI42_007750 [Parastagonospora nodorum]KAH6332415.1 hypothetical protein HBI38_007310 [Parastagonospora nodorum]
MDEHRPFKHVLQLMEVLITPWFWSDLCGRVMSVVAEISEVAVQHKFQLRWSSVLPHLTEGGSRRGRDWGDCVESRTLMISMSSGLLQARDVVEDADQIVNFESCR